MENFAKKIKLSNHTVYIINDNDIVLQSYNAFVARIRDGKLILGPLYDYSPTTWRHVRKFLLNYRAWLNDKYDNYVCTMLYNCKNGHKYFKDLVKQSLICVIDIDKMIYKEQLL